MSWTRLSPTLGRVGGKAPWVRDRRFREKEKKRASRALHLLRLALLLRAGPASSGTSGLSPRCALPALLASGWHLPATLLLNPLHGGSQTRKLPERSLLPAPAADPHGERSRGGRLGHWVHWTVEGGGGEQGWGWGQWRSQFGLGVAENKVGGGVWRASGSPRSLGQGRPVSPGDKIDPGG